MKRLLQINPTIRENTSTGKIMREHYPDLMALQ